MPAHRPAAELSKWRFSLKTLFQLMFMVAVVVWLTSWQMWYMDERIILGSWFFGVVGAIAWSRRRGWRGVFVTSLCGGVVPAVLVLAYYLISLAMWSYTDLYEDMILVSVIVVLVAGVLSGGLLAATELLGKFRRVETGCHHGHAANWKMYDQHSMFSRWARYCGR